MKEVIEFAKKKGYINAKYIGKWDVYNVYEPIFSFDKIAFIGLPLVILKNKNELRMSTPEEAMKILRELNNGSE